MEEMVFKAITHPCLSTLYNKTKPDNLMCALACVCVYGGDNEFH